MIRSVAPGWLGPATPISRAYRGGVPTLHTGTLRKRAYASIDAGASINIRCLMSVGVLSHKLPCAHLAINTFGPP